MTEFNLGDVVYLKDEFVDMYKRRSDAALATRLLPGQRYFVQIGLAKDTPFTIIATRHCNFWLTNFTENWGRRQNIEFKNDKRGIFWNGTGYKTWAFHISALEKRGSNAISLYELNRGL